MLVDEVDVLEEVEVEVDVLVDDVLVDVDVLVKVDVDVLVDVLVDADTKPGLMAHLHANGVGSRPVYPPLHAEPAFAREGDYPVATDISRRGMWLPSSLGLKDDQIALVCSLIRGFLRR